MEMWLKYFLTRYARENNCCRLSNHQFWVLYTIITISKQAVLILASQCILANKILNGQAKGQILFVVKTARKIYQNKLKFCQKKILFFICLS